MRNSCCCFGLVLNFTSEAQYAGRRLCGKAAGNGEVAKGMSMVPMHSRQTVFLFLFLFFNINLFILIGG